MKKTTLAKGVVRPARGPYPKGVNNGPLPTTERGWRRRQESGVKPEDRVDESYR